MRPIHEELEEQSIAISRMSEEVKELLNSIDSKYFEGGVNLSERVEDEGLSVFLGKIGESSVIIEIISLDEIKLSTFSIRNDHMTFSTVTDKDSLVNLLRGFDTDKPFSSDVRISRGDYKTEYAPSNLLIDPSIESVDGESSKQNHNEVFDSNTEFYIKGIASYHDFTKEECIKAYEDVMAGNAGNMENTISNKFKVLIGFAETKPLNIQSEFIWGGTAISLWYISKDYRTISIVFEPSTSGFGVNIVDIKTIIGGKVEVSVDGADLAQLDMLKLFKQSKNNLFGDEHILPFPNKGINATSINNLTYELSKYATLTDEKNKVFKFEDKVSDLCYNIMIEKRGITGNFVDVSIAKDESESYVELCHLPLNNFHLGFLGKAINEYLQGNINE